LELPPLLYNPTAEDVTRPKRILKKFENRMESGTGLGPAAEDALTTRILTPRRQTNLLEYVIWKKVKLAYPGPR
jgi:hypothetical protein